MVTKAAIAASIGARTSRCAGHGVRPGTGIMRTAGLAALCPAECSRACPRRSAYCQDRCAEKWSTSGDRRQAGTDFAVSIYSTPRRHPHPGGPEPEPPGVPGVIAGLSPMFPLLAFCNTPPKGNVCPDGAPGSRATSFWSQTTTTLSGGPAAPPALERTLCFTTLLADCTWTQGSQRRTARGALWLYYRNAAVIHKRGLQPAPPAVTRAS
jgi:hypothetical protein